MTAWALAQAGHRVELFEKHRLMAATSSASTKLLHGGLRYLETGQFRLVREALQERAWWVEQAPHLAKPIRIILPVFHGIGRPAWLIRIGLTLYDLLALGSGFPRHRWHGADEVRELLPELKSASLQGAFSYHDAQMDDYALGHWTSEQAKKAGVVIHEGMQVDGIDTAGNVKIGGRYQQFDQVINVAGPWAEQLLRNSGISSKNSLDLVRGSHILFDQTCPAGCFLQVPGDRRIFFVLPYQGKTLVGTTEVRQALSMPIECSQEEVDYLLAAYNHYFADRKVVTDVTGKFAGVRPLIRSANDPLHASREYAIERTGKLITVFGGKWTTARQLGKTVARQIGETT